MQLKPQFNNNVLPLYTIVSEVLTESLDPLKLYSCKIDIPKRDLNDSQK